MNIHAALHEACTRIKKSASSNEAKLEAQLLLEHVLNVSHAWLIAHADDEIQPAAYFHFETLILRRVAGEPIAYILGEREFYGLKLKVTPDTLIPRADTETLVEAALAKIPQTNKNPASSSLQKRDSNEKETVDSRFGQNGVVTDNFENLDSLQILDLGTGSGAIALAIAKNRPYAQITAVDASNAALDVAIENAKTLKISNISYVQSNWYAAVDHERFDVIVSNPPYIEADDQHLSQGDLRFEPITALTSGQDGLDDIKQIIANAKHHLKPNGWLMLEHGYNQANAVAALLKLAEFSDIQHVKDLAGIDRVTLGQY
jgi:release factor glutamine methyltransferase